MQWRSFPHEFPKRSGNYIVSVHKQQTFGIKVFNYPAQFDEPTRRWYKYDGFDNNYEPTEDITEMVAGWVDDLGAYGGAR